MNPKKWIAYIKDGERDIQERLLALMSLIALGALGIITIVGVLVGESATDLIVLAACFVAFFITAELCLKYDRIRIGGNIVAFVIILVLVPVTFFTGGGINGGSPIWFVFCIFYGSMVLSGVLRWVFMFTAAVVAGVCYTLAWLKPELVTEHDAVTAYQDSMVSLVLVCTLISIMLWFEIRVFREEKRRTEEQKARLEELSNAQNRFFSSMSHEIRTPINTIIGLNEMILRENASDEINEDAANIQSAGKMLLHLINDILDMSKLESGQMQIVNARYSVGDMLSEIVGMMWIRTKEKNLDFHVEVSPDIPAYLIGDDVRIRQILVNVLNNAFKYTNEGSVTLSIQCEPMEDDRIRVIFSVSDTGVGIKKENIPHLFTAFRRVDESDNRYIEGTGLGLSIVKQFVDLMGGKITVNSIYKKGSTFRIEIPQKVPGGEKLGEFDMQDHHGSVRREDCFRTFEAPEAHVLVVDDTPANLMVVTKLLRETGVKITTAESGEQALKETLNQAFHVIFMDHLMPGMDGIECLHRIRNQIGGLSKEARVVALTANAGKENQTLYAREGFDGYLVKPVSGIALEKELHRLLPKDLISMTGTDEKILEETMSWIEDQQNRQSVVITTESVADLPQEILDRYHIAVIPHMVETGEGVFRDGQEIEQSGLLSYMEDRNAVVNTLPPSVADHEDFFAKQLEHANNVIHISISSKIEKSGCRIAEEAARAFDNVYVIDTGHLSSGQGLIAIEAGRLVESGAAPDEIVEHLEVFKNQIRTSFIVDNLDYLARAKQVGERASHVINAFLIRPVLTLRNGKMTIGNVYFGSRRTCWRAYIAACLAQPEIIDKRLLFVTYVGLTTKDLDRIREEIERRTSFERIIFQKASPAIAVNCGPGTFGLLYQFIR